MVCAIVTALTSSIFRANLGAWGFPGYAGDVLTGNSDVSQLAVAKVRKLPHSVLISPPRTKVANKGNKHFSAFLRLSARSCAAAICDDGLDYTSGERKLRTFSNKCCDLRHI